MIGLQYLKAASRGKIVALLLSASVGVLAPNTLVAQELPSPFVQVLAAGAAEDAVLQAFYHDTNYATLWTGAEDSIRLSTLLQALSGAAAHGLPVARYDVEVLQKHITEARTEGDRARLELALSRAYLAYARDVSSGATEPAKIMADIVREIPRPDLRQLLDQVKQGDLAQKLRDLPPKAAHYTALMRAKLDLEGKIAQGGWGPVVAAKSVAPGASGAEVVALRDRLMAMGYLGRSASRSYDAEIEAAVQRFQLAHGLPATGSANEATLAALNIAPEERLKSIIVAMERQRWMGDAPLGDRHIWVNIADMSTRIVDQGKITFETRSVVGKNTAEQRTPEFSDLMNHMVVNPSWGVPRSITVREYLPLLQRNRNAVSHLQVIDSRGRVVPRSSVNFANFTARSFPYSLRQPPSDGNALGKVKFMFPNKYAIYLHDTPAKNLFSHQVRAYSHGCIRLADPFDFAHALLAMQSDTPTQDFKRALDSGKETYVKLEQPVPIHLVYFTAFANPRGAIGYRDDVYGRDAKLFHALEEAGLALPALRG